MSFVEKKLEETLIYKGGIFSVHKARVLLPDGKEAVRERISHGGGAGILPLSDRGTVYLVRQYRFGVDRTLLEIPAGKLEPGEDPLKTAARELTEEVGFYPGKITPLGPMELSPAYLGEITYLYLGEQLRPQRNALDDDEFLEVVELPFRKAIEMVLSGEITDGKTQTALLKALALGRM